MRDVFPGYYKPTKDELTDLWANALLVLDTNALFNLFRYSNDTRKAFLAVLEAKRARLWLPHQVGLEFHRGRLAVVDEQAQAFSDLIAKSKSALATITKDVGTLRNHPTLDLADLRKTIDAAFESIVHTIEATQKKYQTEILAESRHDQTMHVITDLYAERVGQAYDVHQLKKVYDQGKERYEAKQPPGYKDANKPEPARYGDLVLWCQILDKAQAETASVIFVGDDQKEDWWREFKGKKIGPRVELIDEFRERTGKRIYFLTPHTLMELAKDLDNASISTDVVQEVADVSESLARSVELLRAFQIETDQQREVDTINVSNAALESRLHQLERRRGHHEKSLRRVLSSIRDFDNHRIGDPGEQVSLERALSRERHEVAQISSQMKEIESELWRRRHESSSAPLGGLKKQHLLDLARFLLSNEGVPVSGRQSNWDDASDDDVLHLLLEVEFGTADPDVARALRPIAEDVTEIWNETH